MRLALSLLSAAALGGPTQAAQPSLADSLSPPIAEPAPIADAPLSAGDLLSPVPEEGALTPAGQVDDQPCAACNGADGVRPFYNRCGCDTQLFPWFTGPGDCDNWCVGPHWNVEVDGMFFHRDDANWGDIAGATVVDQFNFGPGVRIFATGYNYSNYGLQVGYEGVNDFNSTAVTATDRITYESTLNSLEFNVLRRTTAPLKLFAGFRYIELDEDYVDMVTASGDSDSFFIENRLIGFQVGSFRDAWQLNRWITIEPFVNAGAYINDFKREDVNVAGGAYTTVVSNFDEMAFVGEAGITSVLRINRCLALRGGYQIMTVTGVGEALDASLVAGLDPTDIVFHGARFGVEYQR
jgi:hypothetical protein